MAWACDRLATLELLTDHKGAAAREEEGNNARDLPRVGNAKIGIRKDEQIINQDMPYAFFLSPFSAASHCGSVGRTLTRAGLHKGESFDVRVSAVALISEASSTLL
jgi:hypothetical protein